MKKHLSIGLRLTLSYLLIFAIAQLIFGLGMWFILRHNLYDIADDTLEGQIDDVRHFLEAQRKDASTPKLQEEVNEAYVLEHSGDYLQIRDEQGNWIYRSSFLQDHNLSAVSAKQLTTPWYEDRRLGGRSFRFLSETIEVHGRNFVIQTGVPVNDILRTLSSFRRYLLIFAALILLAASAVGYWLSRRALAPVDALTRTARSISGTNLSSRLERLDTGDELQRLSDTLTSDVNERRAVELRQGDLFVTGPHGNWVWDAQGHHLATIVMPEQPTNLAWGDKDYNTLYITATTSAYCQRTKVRGFVPYSMHRRRHH